MKKIKKVSVIGLGYIGLPLLVAIDKADQFQVIGFDTNQSQVERLCHGKVNIQDKTVKKYLSQKQLEITNDPEQITESDVYIICVPTPVLDDFSPDYSAIESSVILVSKYLKKGAHLVLESTVNPGTCDEIIIPLLEKSSGLKVGGDFNIAHCPERINPGDEKWNIYNIPRNIGSVNQEYNQQIAEFYRTILPQAEINEVNSLKIAEATKIVENTFRDINIAYVNELAQSFDSMGVDLYQTLTAASSKPFGFMPHWPGCGVGGHCIAVDPYYLIRQAEKNGFNHRFLKLAREINNGMPQYTVHKLITALDEAQLSLANIKISLLGLSYKADIADLRQSPAVVMEKILLEMGANLEVYDPYIERANHDLKAVISQSDVVLIATAHREIINNLPSFLKNSLVKVVMDGRNCLSKTQIEKMEIIYLGIGH